MDGVMSAEAAMATLWKGVKKEQTDGAAASGWWVRGPSGGRARYPYGLSGIVLLVAGAVGQLSCARIDASAADNS